MNPGPIEEGGKIATALVESLKAQPAVLAILVFNLILMGLVYFSTKEFRALNAQVISTLLTQQKDMVAMISKCVVPTPTSVDSDLSP